MRIQSFDSSADLLQVILWQYNDAESIISLISQKQTWYDINLLGFWNDWFTNVFNLQTANAFGLSVWALILDIPLYVNTSDEPDNYAFVFGFNENLTFPALLNTYQNFNGVGTLPVTGNGANFSDKGTRYILSLEEQRFILQLRYFQLTTRGDIFDINSFLNYLYLQKMAIPGFGKIWVLDGLNMTMRYVFDYQISLILLQILEDLDLLPRPDGVGLQYYVVSDTTFGFDTTPSVSGNQNFFNSNFIPDSFFSA